MRIMISGSMSFAKEMLETAKALEEMGHEPLFSPDTEACVSNPDLVMDLVHCSRTAIDKACFDLIASADAILVLNYPRKGIEGYIGGATLMEIGLARHLNKRIFLLHQIPSEKDLRYAFEVRLTNPVVLDGDISAINR